LTLGEFDLNQKHGKSMLYLNDQVYEEDWNQGVRVNALQSYMKCKQFLLSILTPASKSGLKKANKKKPKYRTRVNKIKLMTSNTIGEINDSLNDPIDQEFQ